VTKQDRIRKDVIRQRVGIQSMEEIRKRRRLEWYCHVKRMDEYRLPKGVIEMEVTNCKRPMGRPRTRWEDQVTLEFKSLLGCSAV
jgi:hypothetical protein